MKSAIAILLIAMVCCIGYRLGVPQARKSCPLMGSTSTLPEHEATHSTAASPSVSDSAQKAAITLAPPRPKRSMAGTLDDGFKTPWTRILVAFSVDDGCTGLYAKHELVISRKDDGLAISGRKYISDRRFATTPERSLRDEEFEDIVSDLNEFYRIAKNEVNLGEHFQSLPPAERTQQLLAYEGEHGARHGGFGGTYFRVQFDMEERNIVVMNAFAEPESVQKFIEWMRVWRRTCWAAIGI